MRAPSLRLCLNTSSLTARPRAGVRRVARHLPAPPPSWRRCRAAGVLRFLSALPAFCYLRLLALPSPAAGAQGAGRCWRGIAIYSCTQRLCLAALRRRARRSAVRRLSLFSRCCCASALLVSCFRLLSQRRAVGVTTHLHHGALALALAASPPPACSRFFGAPRRRLLHSRRAAYSPARLALCAAPAPGRAPSAAGRVCSWPFGHSPLPLLDSFFSLVAPAGANGRLTAAAFFLSPLCRRCFAQASICSSICPRRFAGLPAAQRRALLAARTRAPPAATPSPFAGWCRPRQPAASVCCFSFPAFACRRCWQAATFCFIILRGIVLRRRCSGPLEFFSPPPGDTPA